MLEEWKNTFRQVELDFFRRDDAEWPKVYDSKLEDLDDHYADRHEGHVLILNDKLDLFPPLDPTHFGKGIRIRDLQRDFVEPRIHGRRVELGPVIVPARLRESDFGLFKVRSEGEDNS